MRARLGHAVFYTFFGLVVSLLVATLSSVFFVPNLAAVPANRPAYLPCVDENNSYYIRTHRLEVGTFVTLVEHAKCYGRNSAGRVMFSTIDQASLKSCTVSLFPTDTVPLSHRPAVGNARLTVAAGIPFPCLVGWIESSNGAELPHTSRGLIKLNTTHFLPYRPHWLGLLANTAWFAALAFGVNRLAEYRRARRRARAHLCTRCSYDLAATPDDRPCPECGTRRSSITHTYPSS